MAFFRKKTPSPPVQQPKAPKSRKVLPAPEELGNERVLTAEGWRRKTLNKQSRTGKIK